MGPFDLVVDNEAEGTAPMDTGSSSDGDAGTTGAADETTTAPAQDDGSFPDAAACECRSDGRPDRAALVLLALALRPRRRRR
jgi:MYXO-CTERM domain-containing protein